MSEETEKGTRWSANIAKELEHTDYGLICLTRDNLEAPWIHFEAGALAKSMDGGRVAPLLFGLKKSDIQGPLAQFQLTNFDETDVRRLLGGMNSSKKEGALDDARISKVFRALWKELDDSVLKAMQNYKVSTPPPAVSSQDILEELLVLARNQSKSQMGISSANDLVDKIVVALIDRRVVADMPSIPNFVWEDLADSWSPLRERLFANIENMDNETLNKIKEAGRMFGGPMDYLLDRLGPNYSKRRVKKRLEALEKAPPIEAIGSNLPTAARTVPD